jgi:hypothetical protein
MRLLIHDIARSVGERRCQVKSVRACLLAGDDAGILSALSRLLEPSCEIVGKIADGKVRREAAARLAPDVIVLHLSMLGAQRAGRVSATQSDNADHQDGDADGRHRRHTAVGCPADGSGWLRRQARHRQRAAGCDAEGVARSRRHCLSRRGTSLDSMGDQAARTQTLRRFEQRAQVNSAMK